VHVSQSRLILISAFVWYAGGISLLIKSGALLKEAYLLAPHSVWTFGAPILGIVIGLLKGKFIFSSNCKKNIQRIRALEHPRIWQLFRPGMLVFLAIIIPTGAMMSKLATGNFAFLCFVGGLDLSIAFALLSSSLVFWRSKAFSVNDATKKG